MNATTNETVLIDSKLHWGIFIPPLLFVTVSLVPIIFILLLFHQITSMFAASGVQTEQTFPVTGFLLAVIMVPDLIILLATFASYKTSRVTLTSQRLVFKTGFVARRSGDLQLEKIEATFLSQGLFGRIFNYGTVTVTGTGGTPFALCQLPEPQRFEQTLKQAISNLQAKPMYPATQASPVLANDDGRYMPKG